MPTPSRTLEVLRQRAARLPHEPDRGVRHGLAARGPQEGALGRGRDGGGIGTSKPRRSAGVFAHRQTRPPTYCGAMVVRHETHPGTGAAAWPPEFRDGGEQHARGARCVPRSSARRCPRRSGSRRTPRPVRRRDRRRRPTSAPAGSSCSTTRPATTPGTAPSAAWPTPAPRSTWTWSPTRCWPTSAGRWLTEALEAHGADVPRRLRHRHPRRHRELRRDGRRGRHRPDRDPRVLDARRSPAPTAPLDIAPHVEAWGELLCTAAGLPPVPEGVDGHARAGAASAVRALTLDARPDPDPTRPSDRPDAPSPTRRSPSRSRRSPRPARRPLLDAARRPAGGDRDRRRRWPRRRAALAAGTGPVAIDAERASGYRYSTRAYLIQLRREGAGTALVDPIALRHPGAAARRRSAAPSGSCTPPPRTCPASPRSACTPTRSSTPSWPAGCSATPASAWPRWSRRCSATGCAKEHSAADWSTRPLPEPWLEYAALDVEVLVELRDALAAELERGRQGRVGAPGVRAPARLRADPARRRVAAYVRRAPGPRPPRAGRGARAVGGPRRDRRRSAT